MTVPKSQLGSILFIGFIWSCQSSIQLPKPMDSAATQSTSTTTELAGPAQLSPDDLPDDYLLFRLLSDGAKWLGSAAHFDGFTITLDGASAPDGGPLTLKRLVRLIEMQKVTGTVRYPSGKITVLEFEIVTHRGPEEIYMKSSLGYFVWEYVAVDYEKIDFAIYWWYIPPATIIDFKVLEQTAQLLRDQQHWHQQDDRQCDDDVTQNYFSLFCALKYASLEHAGEYNHHNTAMQNVRFTIDELIPNHKFAHTLMDYNNAESTSHSDIMHCLKIAQQRIKKELSEMETRSRPVGTCQR